MDPESDHIAVFFTLILNYCIYLSKMNIEHSGKRKLRKNLKFCNHVTIMACQKAENIASVTSHFFMI